jgi:hypothetical protein
MSISDLRKAWRAWFVLAVLAVGLLIYLHNKSEAEKAQAMARAVKALPAGTEQAWIAYVDHRLAGAIERRGGSVRIAVANQEVLSRDPAVGLIFGSDEHRLSLNTPYHIICDTVTGGVVEFGVRDDVDGPIEVSIWGMGPYSALAPIAPVLLTEKAPSLSVDKQSVAAARLSEKLCDRVSARLHEIMAE